MNRQQAKELLPIIKAFADGKIIQIRKKQEEKEYYDQTKDNLSFTPSFYDYRIKDNYRPFRDAEECWQEMLKHQPFGWVKSNDDSTPCKCMLIDSLENDIVTIRTNIIFTYDELVKNYIFADGTPFGIKVEE